MADAIMTGAWFAGMLAVADAIVAAHARKVRPRTFRSTTATPPQMAKLCRGISRRGKRLLWHWRDAGMQPTRHVDRCWCCKGKGEYEGGHGTGEGRMTWIVDCRECKGTGVRHWKPAKEAPNG